MALDPTLIDRAILMLTSGMTPDAAAAALIAKANVPEKAAKAACQAAEKRIVLAANYDKTRELGTAIARLNDLYRRAVAIQDTKTALQIQRELNKLLDLYARPEVAFDPNQPAANDETSAAIRYLSNLGLGETNSLPELCRRAAAEILRLRARE